MTQTDQLLDNASRYASDFDKGDLPLPPGRKVAVLACMDARLDPARVLGLEEGDAHVIRERPERHAHAFDYIEGDVRSRPAHSARYRESTLKDLGKDD